ncbi:MAG: hypothetical protein KGD58_14325 [Candidatus Lokiarchaeota archaeon]|nr:hypothetical protein [Candidatus Lokiarchaeota archaeon]
MSEMTTTIKNKKEPLNYVDAIFGVLHFFVIFFALILVQSNIILSIIGIICACTLLILGIRSFNLGEMLYANYGTALMVGSWMYLIPLVILAHFMGFFLFFEIPYLIIIAIKRRPFSASASTFYYRTKRQGKFIGHIGTVPQSNLTPSPGRIKGELQREQVERQANTKKHLYISILLLLTLLVVFVIWFDPSLELDITIPT